MPVCGTEVVCDFARTYQKFTIRGCTASTDVPDVQESIVSWHADVRKVVVCKVYAACTHKVRLCCRTCATSRL